MTMPLLLKFSCKTLNNVTATAGRWQSEGGAVTEDNRHVANYASFRKVTFHSTVPPESITLEGAHDFNSGSETGTVASNSQSAHIGRQYTPTGAIDFVHIG
jgi:hypothetical protein